MSDENTKAAMTAQRTSFVAVPRLSSRFGIREEGQKGKIKVILMTQCSFTLLFSASNILRNSTEGGGGGGELEGTEGQTTEPLGIKTEGAALQGRYRDHEPDGVAVDRVDDPLSSR